MKIIIEFNLIFYRQCVCVCVYVEFYNCRIFFPLFKMMILAFFYRYLIIILLLLLSSKCWQFNGSQNLKKNDNDEWFERLLLFVLYDDGFWSWVCLPVCFIVCHKQIDILMIDFFFSFLVIISIQSATRL